KQMERSLRIQSTAKPKSNLPATIVLYRFSICHDWAAPFEMVAITASMSRPAFFAKWIPSDRPCTNPAIQIWFTIFVSWPAPAGPMSLHMRVRTDHLLRAGIGLCIAAAHDGEHPVFGTGLAARDGRVDEA